MPRGLSLFTTVLGLLVALAICAWYVVGARQAHDTAKAAAIVVGSSSLPRAQAARAASLLDAAGFLNPDRQVDILRAQLAAGQGQPRRAEQILAGVVRAEPMNAYAWEEVGAHARGTATYAYALKEVGHLDPLLVHPSH